jgi:hypothetical protein
VAAEKGVSATADNSGRGEYMQLWELTLTEEIGFEEGIVYVVVLYDGG